MSTNTGKKTRFILIGFSSIVFILVAFSSLSNPISVTVSEGGTDTPSSSPSSSLQATLQDLPPQNELTFDSNHKQIKTISSFDPQHVIQVGKQCYLSRWGGDNDDNDKCSSKTAESSLTKTTTLPSGHQISVTNLLCSQGSLKISLKNADDVKNRNSLWTKDAETKNVADSLRLGAKWLEGYIVVKVVNSMNQSRSELTGIRTMKRFFLWKEEKSGDYYYQSCVCGFAQQPWMRSGSYSIDVYVFDLFKNNDALVETGEDLPVQYCTSMKNEKAVISLDGEQLLQNEKCTPDNEKHLAFAEWAVDVQRDQSTNYETDPRYGGYWLRFKGDKTKGNKFSDSHDLLGRMDFRAKYKFRGGKVRRNNNNHNNQEIDCAQRVAPPPCAKIGCFGASFSRLLVGDPAAVCLLFIGDSHVRTLYYGLLERLDVAFAANRVWRGGHEADVILPGVAAKRGGGAGGGSGGSVGVAAKVKFVPSSFLDMKTVDGAVSQVLSSSGKNKRVIVVAGLGQHHSTHCYSLKRHAGAVKTAVDYFSEKMNMMKRGNGKNNNNNNNTLHLIWYGVPAQPVNRHLFAPKPVGQARKDCRSNSRHLLYSAVQQSLILKAREENNNRDFRFIDAFALSAGLTFTSVDGAHYYSFARDAMLDSLGEELAALL